MKRGGSLTRRTPARAVPTLAPSPRAEADHLIEAVRDLYASGWALYGGVRNTTGAGHEVLRYADGDRVPCQGCLDGDPTDSEMVEAAIADATPDQIETYAALIAARRVA
jgi:hypothetical protein